MTLVSERLSTRMPEARTKRLLAAGEAFVREVTDVIGDGVLLHPPFPTVAPRHGRTVGRPWIINSTTIFNLAGTPVTEVPLGLNRDQLLHLLEATYPSHWQRRLSDARELVRGSGFLRSDESQDRPDIMIALTPPGVIGVPSFAQYRA